MASFDRIGQTVTVTTGGSGKDINVYTGTVAMPVTCNASLSTNYTSSGTSYVAQAATALRFTVRGPGAPSSACGAGDGGGAR